MGLHKLRVSQSLFRYGGYPALSEDKMKISDCGGCLVVCKCALVMVVIVAMSFKVALRLPASSMISSCQPCGVFFCVRSFWREAPGHS